jgi:hypothetical protein
MYDMKPMAESLASQGRYGDSMLVHMNPIEVAGLRAAAQKMGGILPPTLKRASQKRFSPSFLVWAYRVLECQPLVLVLPRA